MSTTTTTTTITIADETTSGARTNELTLDFLTERVTAREVIRARVYQEVTEHNAVGSGVFRGLVLPRAAPHGSPRRRIDWHQQYERALAGFAANGFLLLVDDRQVADLDEEIVLRHDTTVTFLKLVPLVGG